MALRSIATGRVLSFRACAYEPRILAAGELCPVHETQDCMVTYFSRDHLASYSWLELWRAWRWWRMLQRAERTDTPS